MSPRVEWRDGLPPDEGRWWIRWGDGSVEPVEISPPLRGYPRPLIKTLSGVAYPVDANRARITHHAPLVAPDPPKTAEETR